MTETRDNHIACKCDANHDVVHERLECQANADRLCVRCGLPTCAGCARPIYALNTRGAVYCAVCFEELHVKTTSGGEGRDADYGHKHGGVGGR